MTSDALRDLLYNELRFGVRTLIFVANCFLLPRVCLALKDYRNLMPDTIGLIVFAIQNGQTFQVQPYMLYLWVFLFFIP